MGVIEKDITEITSEPLKWEVFNNKNILITGASGMIGNYLTKTFQYMKEEKGINLNLFLLVRNTKQVEKKEYITILKQDVTTPIKISENIHYIIHAASPASPIIMKEKPVDTFKANVMGTINCLELAKEKTAEFIFISSREVYGTPINKSSFSEKDLGVLEHFEPRASYSEGKKAAETIAISYMSQYGVKIKSLRLAHTYGPGININDGRVQSDFLKNYINNESIKMNSDGSSIRTYTYIKDSISGIFYAILKGKEIVYNISNDKEETTILDLAKVISKIDNKNLDIIFEKSNKSSSYSPVKHGILDSSSLLSTGWNPTIKIDEGFKRTIDYLKEKSHE